MNEAKIVRTVIVSNAQGLHARAADIFVKMAKQYECRIEIVKDSQRVDGKSIWDILMLAAEQGTQISLEACGQDAETALNALVELVNSGFAEHES